MLQKNWSAERWAREAHISGTTITRFLNTDDPHRTPSTKTLDKLARAAGVPPLHEAGQILIAIIHRDTLLTAARDVAPGQLDLFSMPPDDYHPAIAKYADCRMVEMDNGRYAVCRNAEPKPGRLVVAVDGDSSVNQYIYAPPVLVSVEMSGKTRPLESPGLQIIGRKVAEFIDHGDDD